MIEEILPAGVSAVEAFQDEPRPVLFSDEEAVISRSVDKRRREFATARVCARTALAALGFAPVPILPGPRGAPGWPSGVVGSITHCAGYRAAAVAHADRIVAIGIDAEQNAPMPRGVLDSVTIEAERPRLERLAVDVPGVCWDRLLFSIKESVYKAWFPLTVRWLDFAEADVTPRPDGTFDARLLVPGPVVGGRRLGGFVGRWMARDGLLITAIALPSTP
ncbi:4'-phosphopantetheinyl transferase superfamily protein [Rugosimonospora acidiphila]|uniref:4'-phosphopantetheinyl transferase superfamily protein n=1 Tax=Rugosimonospora acidiphila TaxID=556531 RepID=A0ABP9SDW9_9ACTN